MDILPRSLRKSTRGIDRVNGELAATLGRWPTSEELAQRLDMPEEELHGLLGHAGARWLVPHFLGLGVIGLSLAAAYVALGLAGVIAFLTPAVMMRLAIKQYVDKTADNVERLEKQNAALQTANVEQSDAAPEL